MQIQAKEAGHVITLNYRDGRPISEQIKDSLRRLIVTGAMAPEEKLPSVRALAASLAINPNTIQKAYNELGLQGYIISMPGKGAFVAPRPPEDPARKKELLSQVDAALAELRWLGVSEAELAKHTAPKEKKKEEDAP